MSKVALITGVTGQDGAYLSEYLLKKGYIVHGIKRRSSIFNTDRIDHLYQDPHATNRNFILHYGDLTDSMNLTRIIQEVQPDEIYNLAAMSHVKVSFDTPEYTANADGIGTLRILEAVRLLGLTTHQDLSGINLRIVWLGAGSAANGDGRRSTRVRLMRWPRCMPTGSRSITARLTACMPATAFCLTMSRRSRRNFCYPKNDPRHHPNCFGHAGQGVPGKPVFETRTGGMPKIMCAPCT